jgi:hypothetical protein
LISSPAVQRVAEERRIFSPRLERIGETALDHLQQWIDEGRALVVSRSQYVAR